MSAKDCRCAIEVVTTGSRDGEPASDGSGTAPFQDGRTPGGEQPEGLPYAAGQRLFNADGDG